MPRVNDPLLNYRFVLELGFLQVAGFSECTGLSQEVKVMEVKEGGRNRSPLKFPDGGAAGNIILKRGIVLGAHADVLFNWHKDVMEGSFDPKANPNRRKVNVQEDIDKRCAIVLLNAAGGEVRRWKLSRAFPVKWAGPDLKALASEVALETLELACEGLEAG